MHLRVLVFFSKSLKMEPSYVRGVQGGLKRTLPTKFFKTFTLSFSFILIYAFLYYLVDSYHNYDAFTKKMDNWLDYVYFSTTTASTVGYGDISPKKFWPKLLVITQFFMILAAIFNIAI